MLTKVVASGVALVAFGLFSPVHAQNGKNPPDVNPTHYQCYTVQADVGSITLKELSDQFGVSREPRLVRPVYLCAPTAKNGVRPRDMRTHYLCYQDVNVKVPGKRVLIINQLTSPKGIVVTVEKPAMLCVPSLKKLM